MHDQGTGNRKRISTALKVLTLMRERAPVALSSHGLGLYIQDRNSSLSEIIKTLHRDGYVQKMGQKGRRTAYWGLTEIGIRSLQNRANLAAEAARWLEQNPSYKETEQLTLMAMHEGEDYSPADIADKTGLRIVPIRNALRKLHERGLVDLDEENDLSTLNRNGVREAERLRSITQQYESIDGSN